MSIFLNKDSKVIVQGITGGEATKHTALMLKAGTQVVGGVNARKAGTTVSHVNKAGQGVELPVFEGNETTIAELQARIAKAIDFVKSIKREQVDGKEGVEVVLKFPSGERKFTGQGYLLNFALPNFYFHATTAYDILRHCGVEVGKRDFLGAPVTL